MARLNHEGRVGFTPHSVWGVRELMPHADGILCVAV